MAASEPQVILKVEELVKQYGNKRVLDGVTFSAHEGEVLVVMGGSGAGKSTIFNCIIGATQVSGGRIWIQDREVTSIKNSRGRDEISKSFGVAFQSGALFNSMSIGENVALPIRYHTKLNEETIRIMVKIKLEQVGLREAENLFPSQISGGMLKRAAFARAMALDPRIVFFDEPSAGLDPVTVAMIDDLILDFAKKMGVTCVVITHELNSAFRIADRMIMLHQGKIAKEGTREAFKNASDPLVQQFIHGRSSGPLSSQSAQTDYLKDLLEA